MLDGRQETMEIAWGSFAGRERDSMLDGEETVQIDCGKLRWEGARQHAGRTGNRANSLGRASLGGSERDSMLDGEETVQIACGKLRWEGARQHAGRIGHRANSLRKASLGGSETACWTERKPCK